MAIVTLTTDFGTTDYYVGAIKGAMLTRFPQLNIIDISHNIKSYDIVQAAYTLKNCYKNFPIGSIHIISVNNFYAENPIFFVLKHNGHYFIGPDNGVFSLLFDELPKNIRRLPFNKKNQFPLKDLFADTVRHFAAKQKLEEIGLPAQGITQRFSLQPVMSPDQIRGSVIHIDNYENVILNITKELFERVWRGRNFALYFKRFDPITKLCSHYHEVPVGDILCLFNSANFLEIAINTGKAGSMLGLQIDDTVQIDFH